MQIDAHELRVTLDRKLAQHNVPGASIAIFSNGRATAASAGLGNITTGVAIDDNTLLHIGSITKVFTTTLVMQLVDQGLVELDENILTYIPDLRLRDRDALSAITVKMLLNHTSGVDGSMFEDHGHDQETIADGISRLSELGQLFPPGMDFSYCNVGLIIAGFLVQRVTGESWYRLVRERIFQPLGMLHSATLPEEAILHRTSVGHYIHPTSNNLVRTSLAYFPLSMAPCGTTLMTSASDLLTFARAHLSQGIGPNGARILTKRSAELMRRVTVSNRSRGYTYIDMGLGWMCSEDGLLAHLGGGPGISAALYAYPPKDFAAVILTNADYGIALANDFLKPWLRELGAPEPMGVLAVTTPRARVAFDPKRYLGTYEEAMKEYFVTDDGAGMKLSYRGKIKYCENILLEASTPTRLIPLGGDQFLMEGRGDHRAPEAFRIIAFRNPDESGRMQHLGNLGRLYRRVA